jgi:LacI family transcriptional regulator
MAAIRMKDIARDLGISAVTVSKVLRGHPDISAATKERVLQRVKELKYRPNLFARGLVTGRSSLVALIVPDLVHAFFSEIAISLSVALREKGYSMLIAWTAEDPEVQLSEMHHLLSLGADAMIVATSGDDTSCFEMLEEREVPYVLLDRDIPTLKAPFVGGDDLLVGKMATECLIGSGCRRIAHICGPAMSPGHRRLKGYKLALEAAGIPVREQYIVTPADSGPHSIHHGFEAAKRLLAIHPRVDGIFAFNDQLAVGAMEAAFALNLKVPDDLQIIGCGNHPLGADLRLALSTIDQDTDKLGAACAKVVLRLLDKSAGPRRISIKPTLMARATSGNGTRKSIRKSV